MANNIIKDSKIFNNVYINPGASDTGIPLGGVYYGYFNFYKKTKKRITASPYLGLSYSNKEIENSLNLLKHKKNIKIHKDKNLKKKL